RCFRLCFRPDAAYDGEETLKEQDTLRVAAQADGLSANDVNNTRRTAQTVARGDDEDTFRMLGRKGPAPRRGARLEQQGRALGRGLAQMRPDHRVMRANVMDRVDLVRIGVDTALGIAPHGPVLPAALPQFI